mmetsp:Transcript_339/g.1011  ORF Transcript_339/g.1011 Transcript_339/m.1011 type:complete len:255 (-) Transcript_339:14-778(-)
MNQRQPLELKIRGLRHGRAAPLNHEIRAIIPHRDALLHLHALHQPRQEPPNKGVAGAVRVHQIVLAARDHRKLRQHPQPRRVADRHDGGLRAVREDDGTGAGVGLAGGAGEFGGDVREGGEVPVHGGGECGGFVFVAEVDVDEGHGGLEGFEEGGDLEEEGGGEVHGEELRGVGGEGLADVEDGVGGHGDEEAGDVRDGGGLHDRPVFRALAVLVLVRVRRREVRHQRPLRALPRDQHRAAPRRLPALVVIPHH